MKLYTKFNPTNRFSEVENPNRPVLNHFNSRKMTKFEFLTISHIWRFFIKNTPKPLQNDGFRQNKARHPIGRPRKPYMGDFEQNWEIMIFDPFSTHFLPEKCILANFFWVLRLVVITIVISLKNWTINMYNMHGSGKVVVQSLTHYPYSLHTRPKQCVND